MRLIPRVAAAFGGLLALPTTAFAAEGTAGGTDHTVEVMLGLIFVLIAAMVVIAIAESRKAH